MHSLQIPKVPCFPPESSKTRSNSGCSTLEKGNLFVVDLIDRLASSRQEVKAEANKKAEKNRRGI